MILVLSIIVVIFLLESFPNITMTQKGLPNILDNTLNTLLEKYIITSWNVKGGNRFTEVSIRFNMASMPHGDMKYRREPPSRMARDKVRAARRFQSKDNLCTQDINEDNASIIHDEQIDNISNPFSRFIADDTVVNRPDHMPTSVEEINMTVYPSPVPQCDGPADHTAIAISREFGSQTDQGGDSDVNNSGIQMENMTLDETEHFEPLAADSPADYDIICSHCHEPQVDRCLQCFKCSDVFICTSCYHAKAHNEHFCFLSYFNPSDVPKVPHCMSCFSLFTPLAYPKVYTCMRCKFIQCPQCTHLWRHDHHLDYLKEVPG